MDAVAAAFIDLSVLGAGKPNTFGTFIGAVLSEKELTPINFGLVLFLHMIHLYYFEMVCPLSNIQYDSYKYFL